MDPVTQIMIKLEQLAEQHQRTESDLQGLKETPRIGLTDADRLARIQNKIALSRELSRLEREMNMLKMHGIKWANAIDGEGFKTAKKPARSTDADGGRSRSAIELEEAVGRAGSSDTQEVGDQTASGETLDDTIESTVVSRP